jgi:hypothetical protein
MRATIKLNDRPEADITVINTIEPAIRAVKEEDGRTVLSSDGSRMYVMLAFDGDRPFGDSNQCLVAQCADIVYYGSSGAPVRKISSTDCSLSMLPSGTCVVEYGNFVDEYLPG